MPQPTIEQMKLMLEEDKHKPKPTGNPCVAIYGQGRPGQPCQGCRHLLALEYAKVYYKCELRQNTHGAKTDHKVRWPSCAKYEKEA